jgi:pSer/pThr/pTyr-binding forkhead associated (FHA) protein
MIGYSSQSSSVSISNQHVSRKHFQIYAVVFEENGPNDEAMVYVKDLWSLSGTTVNGKLIGQRALGASRGYLLGNGDIVGISPFWEFKISLKRRTEKPLQGIQLQEAKVLSSRNPHKLSLMLCRCSTTDTSSRTEFWDRAASVLSILRLR